MSRQHPDEHQHDGEREGQQLGQGEAAAAAEGNPGEGSTESLQREGVATAALAGDDEEEVE